MHSSTIGISRRDSLSGHSGSAFARAKLEQCLDEPLVSVESQLVRGL